MSDLNLLDEKDDRVYLVYLTNRQHPFVLFERDFNRMMDRAAKEIQMGFTQLWTMKRIGVILPEKVCYFPDNELLLEPQSFAGALKNDVYIIFLFAKKSPASPFVFTKGMAPESHRSFEAAAASAARLLDLMKDTYPDRDFKVLCAKLLYSFPWHG